MIRIKGMRTALGSMILLLLLSGMCLAGGHRNSPMVYDDKFLCYERLDLDRLKPILYKGKYYPELFLTSYTRNIIGGIPIGSSRVGSVDLAYDPETHLVAYVKKDTSENAVWGHLSDADYAIRYLTKKRPELLTKVIEDTANQNVIYAKQQEEVRRQAQERERLAKEAALVKKRQEREASYQHDASFAATALQSKKIEAYDAGKNFIWKNEEDKAAFEKSWGLLSNCTNSLWELSDESVKYVVALVPRHVKFISGDGELERYSDNMVIVRLMRSELGEHSVFPELTPESEMSLIHVFRNGYVYDIDGDASWQWKQERSLEQVDTTLQSSVTIGGVIYTVYKVSPDEYKLVDDSRPDDVQVMYLRRLPNTTLPIYPADE